MSSNYGIPYMGSKSDIVASIAINLPSADNFYDLFGGGFCVTHYMIEKRDHKYKNFHFNEINKNVVDLIKKAINGDFNYDKFKPPWISREDFFKYKDNDAYISLVWSFGNSQTSYIFGKDIEKQKRSLHQAIIFNEFDEFAEKLLGFKTWPSAFKDKKKRRLYVRQKVVFESKGKSPGDLQQLQQLQQLERLQQLQQLQRLQQLEQLQRLQQLHFYSSDYREVPILPNSIVYCDIPYKDTKGYGVNFSHKEFYDWAATRDFPVYISEYACDDSRFELAYSVGKSVKMSSQGQTKEDATIDREKLFWNRK